MIRCHLRTDASGCGVDKRRRSVGDVNNAPLHGELEEMEEMERLSVRGVREQEREVGGATAER